MQTQTIGEIRIDRLMESEGAFADANFLFPEISPTLIQEQADWLLPTFVDPETQKIIMSFHSLLIRSSRSTILVDCCVGNDKHRPTRPEWHQLNTPWLAKLNKLGLQPEDIDYVLCTHGIRDWLTGNGYRLFQTLSIFLANLNISIGKRHVVRT